MLRSLSRLLRRCVLLLASTATPVAIACGPPATAPDMTVITLTASPTAISRTGSTLITATLTCTGCRVESGTMVSFETTWGVLDATHSHTIGTQATMRLSGAGRDGTANVVATSGSARSEPLQIVIGGALAVTLAAVPLAPSVAEIVKFTATPASPGPAVARYDWDFGDPAGGTLNTRSTTDGSASYIYTTTGAKTVTVKAMGADGTSATAQVTVVVWQR